MEKEKQILDINNWALQYPHRVFDNDFLLQRKYLTEETWKSVILANPDMLDSASDKWRKIPDANIVNKYQGQAFSGEVRKAINEDGVKVALGALAIPTVIAGGVPFLEAAGNTALTAGQALYYKPVQTLTNFGAGLVGDITGSLATDAIVRSTTDLNNFGEWFNYKTGLPETVGHFLNPGGLIGGGLAAGVTNKLLYPWASNLDRSIVISRMLNNGVKNVDLSKVYRPNITSKSRFKLGDVEIYDPNLYYRQIGSKVAREFPKTGRLIPTLKEVGYDDDLASVHNRSLRFKLGKVPFENPMYAEGNLWYGIPQKGNIDGLLVTNIPMRWATKSSKPTAYGPIKISEDGLVTTVRTGFDVGNVGSRRIPYDGTITPQNTTAYEFIPGYGYRKILMHPQKVSYKFYERPSTLTEAERLGIPKGERSQLDRMQKEALEDLFLYKNSGQYRQIPNITEDGITWGTTTNGISPLLLASNIPGARIIGDSDYAFVRFPYKQHQISYYPQNNSFGAAATNSLKGGEFGELTIRPTSTKSKVADRKLILTSPRADALGIGTAGEGSLNINNYSDVIDKNVVKSFSLVVSETSRPGTYYSGDNGLQPLGAELIRRFNLLGLPKYFIDNNGTKTVIGRESWDDIINKLLQSRPKGSFEDGLSTDSYMYLLKQGNRPGNSLRFGETPFEVFNNLGVKHKQIYDLWLQAKNGEISNLEFIKRFNEWVAPYNGMPAYVNRKGKLVIPHPYVYTKKQGGTINYLNLFK